MAVIEAYFDESYDDTLLCLAGYIFTKTNAKALEKKWRALLRRNKDLPYFRMSACAHGNYPFDRLTPPERDQVAREAIALIREHAAFGIAITVDEHEFNRRVPDVGKDVHGEAYEFAAWNCLMGVSNWLEITGRKGRVGYFFEAGHKHQARAHRLMDYLFQASEHRDQYQYGGHGFVPKESSCAIQAADLLAWQFFQHRKRVDAKKPQRKDFEALVKGKTYNVRHIDIDIHIEQVNLIEFRAPLGPYPWKS